MFCPGLEYTHICLWDSNTRLWESWNCWQGGEKAKWWQKSKLKCVKQGHTVCLFHEIQTTWDAWLENLHNELGYSRDYRTFCDRRVPAILSAWLWVQLGHANDAKKGIMIRKKTMQTEESKIRQVTTMPYIIHSWQHTTYTTRSCPYTRTRYLRGLIGVRQYRMTLPQKHAQAAQFRPEIERLWAQVFRNLSGTANDRSVYYPGSYWSWPALHFRHH